jgi:uncharacterized protein YbjQ (UPF0145 family)
LAAIQVENSPEMTPRICYEFSTMRSPLFFIAIILITATSCGSAQTVDPQLRRQAATVAIVPPGEVGERTYTIISEVGGMSCAKQQGASASHEGAQGDMRISAAKLGADAIINAFCEELGTSFRSNCWSRVECRGDAIHWDR